MTISQQFPTIILASSSPYRRELFGRLRLPFEIEVPNVDESPRLDETPEQTALRLAQDKAEIVAKRRPGSVVIGSDQVATLDGQQIGKPGTHEKALEQLRLMRGRRVLFHTALCVWDSRLPDASAAQIENIVTEVSFRDLSDQELNNYLLIEQPYDCAGSAKNEGLGIALLDSIKSHDPTALTGLPLIALTSMLRRLSIPFFTL